MIPTINIDELLGDRESFVFAVAESLYAKLRMSIKRHGRTSAAGAISQELVDTESALEKEAYLLDVCLAHPSNAPPAASTGVASLLVIYLETTFQHPEVEHLRLDVEYPPNTPIYFLSHAIERVVRMLMALSAADEIRLQLMRKGDCLALLLNLLVIEAGEKDVTFVRERVLEVAAAVFGDGQIEEAVVDYLCARESIGKIVQRISEGYFDEFEQNYLIKLISFVTQLLHASSAVSLRLLHQFEENQGFKCLEILTTYFHECSKRHRDLSGADLGSSVLKMIQDLCYVGAAEHRRKPGANGRSTFVGRGVGNTRAFQVSFE